MKKIVLGLAVCWCVTASGMEKRLVDSAVRSPEDSGVLSRLVANVIADNGRVLEAKRLLDEQISPDDESKNLFLYRISSMLYRISVDIRTRGTLSVMDYVDGAMKGTFGPYD